MKSIGTHDSLIKINITNNAKQFYCYTFILQKLQPAHNNTKRKLILFFMNCTFKIMNIIFSHYLLNFSQFCDRTNNPLLLSVLAFRLFREIDTPLLFYPRSAIGNANYSLKCSMFPISSLTTPLLPRIIMDRS